MIERYPSGNVVYGTLPKGCELCLRGRKAILFITGLCTVGCFYCPISLERRRDVVLINERRARNFGDLVDEIIKSGATGVGITGGDPLLKFSRTLNVIRYLKREFGKCLHIHIYLPTPTVKSYHLSSLVDAEVDEIRLHPINLETPPDVRWVSDDISIGLEVPVFPDREGALRGLMLECPDRGFKFINLNELEFSETNSRELIRRGYRMSSDYVTVMGSAELGLKMVNWATRKRLQLTVHFCPRRSKDVYQTGLRMYRRGIICARAYEVVTDCGTLLRGVTCARPDVPHPLYKKYGKGYITSPFFGEKIAECDTTDARTLLNLL